MLIGDDLPKLGADLVPALPRLDVHNLTHGWKEEKGVCGGGANCCVPGLWLCVGEERRRRVESETGCVCEI